MKRLLVIILGCWLLLASPCRAESLNSTSFTGQLMSQAINNEAEVKIISLSQNDFSLLPGEIIRVNFYPSEAGSELNIGALVSGKLFYRQAEVNQELVDWYLVKDYQVSPPPLLSEQNRKLLAMILALVGISSLLAAEKIRQKNKKLL